MYTTGNVCGACGLDFSSVSAFDAHRVGKHAYTYSEGLRETPPRGWEPTEKDSVWVPREDGRRCLALYELPDRGFALDARGRWGLTASWKKVRKAFQASPVGADEMM